MMFGRPSPECSVHISSYFSDLSFKNYIYLRHGESDYLSHTHCEVSSEICNNNPKSGSLGLGMMF